ncbi:SSI family serine proteinase inhibitor [Streptomyces sp. NPDC092296]|uniref:SSI family serine proteinase inhibitor n=1 Tax=Streptomyces sp. NPDC092296 TaxID=3366012 RepID=UPI0037F4B3A7
MPWSRALPAAALAAAAALVAVPAPGAAADSPGPAGSRLVLTLHSGENAAGRVLGSVSLECAPDGGSHPRPGDACAALRAAHGDPAAVRAQRGVMCPMLYAPVTGRVVGSWDGHPVEFIRTYANRCVAGGESGGVFQF